MADAAHTPVDDSIHQSFSTLPCPISESPITNKPTSSFLRFRSLPPELRRAIWRWLLVLDQDSRVLSELRVVREDDHDHIVQQLFMPNASVVSPYYPSVARAATRRCDATPTPSASTAASFTETGAARSR
ncbi:hypothetical protein PG988_007377 [Apiospora saccharicola]